MSRRSLTGLLALLLVAIVATVWFVASGPGEETLAPDRILPGAGVAPRGAATGGTDLDEELRLAEGEEGPAREALERERPTGVAAARGRWWTRPRDAQWVRGTVVMPAGTPFDEEVWVEAEGSAFPSDPEGRRKHKARVAADGSFRVAFAPKTHVGRIDLVARYVYLDERTKVDFDDPETFEDLRIEPALGGLALVRVLPPHHAAFADGPLAGVEVSGSKGGGFGRSSQDGWWTGREGEWEVGGLAPGEDYVVHARSPLWANGKTGGVTIRKGEVTVVNVALSVGVRISGQVVDEQGRLVPGGEVSAMTKEELAGRNPFVNNNEASRADAAGGTFELNGVPPGDLVVVAECDGYLEGQFELGQLGDGAERHDLTVRVDSGGKLSGFVKWPSGDPAQGALVRVAQGTTLGQGAFQIEQVRGTLEVGPDGTFYFSGLDPETPCNVTASAIHPDDRPDPRSKVSLLLSKRIPRWVASVMEVRPGAPPLALELSPGDVLVGKVVDDQGEPVKNFAVLASPAGTNLFNRSSRRPVRGRFRDEQGRFFLKGVQDGEWEVKVAAPGHADSERRRVIVPSPGELAFTLPRTGSVAGTVFDPKGRPAARARVVLEHGGGKTSAASTDEEGAFEVAKVSPGEVELSADSDDAGQSLPLVLRLGAGEQREDLILQLRPGATILAAVHPDAGKREGRQITLNRKGGDSSPFAGMGGGMRNSARTDEEGEVAFEGLDPGLYELELSPEGGLDFGGDGSSWLLRFVNQKKVEVDVAAGAVAQVTIGGPSPTQVVVSGTITAQGEPVARALVTAMDLDRRENRPSAAVNADEQGHYEIKLDNPGKWRFNVRAGQGEWTTVVADIPEVAEHELDFQVPEARLLGLLTGPDGSLLAGMRLSLVDKDSDGLRNNWFAQRSAATGEDGRFEFGNLQPGTYHLRAGGSDGGFGMFREKGEEYGRVLVVIEVISEDETIERDVQLPLAGEIVGTVRNLAGEPRAGAVITVTDEAGRALSQFEMVRSGPDGNYEYRGLGPGSYLVRARHGGGGGQLTSEARRVKVFEGGRVEVPLVVE